jgi:hypothetical protein
VLGAREGPFRPPTFATLGAELGGFAAGFLLVNL